GRGPRIPNQGFAPGNQQGNQGFRNQGGNQRFDEDQMAFNDAGGRRSQRRSNSFAGNPPRAALGVTLDPRSIDGAWVLRVFPNSPADQAGIRPGDEILALDGED